MSDLISATRNAVVVEQQGKYRISTGGSDLVRMDDDASTLGIRKGDMFEDDCPLVQQLPELFCKEGA